MASGEYASESEVIRDSLRTLMAGDADIEAWLAEEVAPTVAAIDAGTMAVRPLEEARQRLHGRLDRMVERRR